MATLQTIWDEEVAPVIQDSSFDIDDGVRLFNRCIDEVSGIVLLPALETVGTVSTVTTGNSVALPTGYQRNLRLLRSSTHNRFIPIYGSLALLFREYRVFDQTGPVTGIAAKGSTLYYQKIPSSVETFNIHYWASPPAYTESQTPDVIPVHTQRGLLSSYALWKLFSSIEDGMDGATPNVQRYFQEFNDHLGNLVMFIGPEHNEPIGFYDEARIEYSL